MARPAPQTPNKSLGAPPSPAAFTINGEVFFDPHPGQLVALQQIIKRVRTGDGASKYFLRGNRGGGKSFMGRRGLCHSLAMALPGFTYVMVRRNMPDLRQNHLIYLGAEMRKLGGTYHETHGIAKYNNGSMGFYRPCEEFSDVEKIVGAEAALLFVDEAPQIAWDNLVLMLPSLRVAKGADGVQPWFVAAVYSGNPTGESIDDLDKRFVEQDVDPGEDPSYTPADWCHVPMHLKDNPSVDPDEYLKQLGPIPAAFRSAWIDGVRMDSRALFTIHKTVTARVLVERSGQKRAEPLPESMLDRPYHYIQELPSIQGVPLLRVPWITVARGYDHGFYPDPAACVWLAIVGRRIIAVRDGTWFSTTAKDIAASLIEQTRDLVGDTPVSMTYVDPEIAMRTGVQTVMDDLEMHGVPCEPSIADRVLYADAIHGLLGEEVEPGVPRFQIYEPGCPMLAKYLPKMRWDEKNPRKMADHRFDHWVCALAYFAISSGVLSISEKQTDAIEPAWMAWVREATDRPRGRQRA